MDLFLGCCFLAFVVSLTSSCFVVSAAPDFNGDRATMEYQGIDPDVRGPFPPGTGGLRAGGSMMHPA